MHLFRQYKARRSKLYIVCSDFFQKVRAHSFRCSFFSSSKRSAGLRLDEMGALDWCIFFVNIVQQRSHDESRDFFVGFRSFYSLHPSEISMLGVGKAAPVQFILRGKTNLRRISAAGQKAGFTAYPSHWASIWWDVIGGQCIFFVNTMQLVASFVPLATSFCFQKIHHALAPLLLLSKGGPLRWARIWCEKGQWLSANVPF